MKTKILYIIVLTVCISYYAFGQPLGSSINIDKAAFLPDGFHFFGALISGVILALALNLLFTNLAVAAGISMVKPENKIRPGPSYEKKEDTSERDTSRTVKKINHGFGLWMLVITSICLFFSCWFAIEISGTTSPVVAGVVALTIWGAFYLILTALEATLLSTALGGLYRTATSTLQTVGKGVKSVFEKSPETQAADTAAKITAAVREEIFGDITGGQLKKELQRYIQQLRPPTARDIKNEIADLLSNTEVHQYPDIDQVVTKFEQQSRNKERAQTIGNQIRDAFNTFRQNKQAGKDTVSAGIETAMGMAGKSPEDAKRQRERLEEYLRNTNKAELQPEEIKKNIETIFTRPREGFAQLKATIGAIDKNTTVALLEQRQDISHDEAMKIADNIQSTLDRMKSILGGTTEKVSQTKDAIENRLREYMASLDEPALNYDDIKEDLKTLMHDPKAGADSLINRLKAMDRDTIKSIIASHPNISDEQAEQIISKVEETRDEIIDKAMEMKATVKQKIINAQETAAKITEETRKNAAIAAWWAFWTAVVSGIASVLGSVVAYAT